MMYLSDLVVYNTYVKKLTSHSLKQIKEMNKEEVKHNFLFITEAQKSSDRLY